MDNSSSASQSTKIEVIPTNVEKFIALNFGVFVETRKTKRNKVAVYEYLYLIDSFKFMLSSCSLDKLLQSLPDTKFSLLDHFYRGYTDDQQKLLKRKGNITYSYVDSFSKLSDLSLWDLRSYVPYVITPTNWTAANSIRPQTFQEVPA